MNISGATVLDLEIAHVEEKPLRLVGWLVGWLVGDFVMRSILCCGKSCDVPLLCANLWA